MQKLDIYKYQDNKFNALVSLFFEKITQENDRIMIFCPDKAVLQSIDKILWEYNQSSWIPHLLENDQFANEAQILLSTNMNNINSSRILCIFNSNITNLAEISQFDRIVYFISLNKFTDYKDTVLKLKTEISNCDTYNQQLTGKWVKE